MRISQFLLPFALALAMPPASIAASTGSATHNIGSCYDLVPMPGIVKPPLRRQLYVLVDQTVIFNDSLKDEVNRKIQEFLSPGDEVILLSFSAYAKGRYPDILLKGLLDLPLTERQRGNMWKNSLTAFDQCVAQQQSVLKSLVSSDLKSIFGNADETLPYTELMGTLRLLSEQMRAGPAAPKRYLLITSDMLEYSDVSSFYSGKRFRLLDPEAEMKKALKAGVIADFKGTDVYVVGAGFSQQQGYQPAQNIEALENFWRLYFKASNATLVAFGAPSLIEGIGSKPKSDTEQ